MALVALDGDSVVGALASYDFYIFDLAVGEPHCRRGIATDLIHAFRQIALERGGRVVFVQPDYADPPAIALYESLGTREEVLHLDILRPLSPSDRPRGRAIRLEHRQ